MAEFGHGTCHNYACKSGVIETKPLSSTPFVKIGRHIWLVFHREAQRNRAAALKGIGLGPTKIGELKLFMVNGQEIATTNPKRVIEVSKFEVLLENEVDIGAWVFDH
jgi:hypothetical protein